MNPEKRESVRLIPYTVYENLSIQLDAVAEVKMLGVDQGRTSTEDFVDAEGQETNSVALLSRGYEAQEGSLSVSAMYVPDSREAIILQVEHENPDNQNRYMRNYLAEQDGSVHLLIEEDGDRRVLQLQEDEVEKVNNIVRNSFVAAMR